MSMNKYQAYQTNSVYTASQAELILMLYNGAIKFSNKTIDALEKNDMYKAHLYSIRIQDIIGELQATLDMNYEIAKTLDNMYEVIKNLLFDANIDKDIEKTNEIKNLIMEMRDLWKQVIK